MTIKISLGKLDLGFGFEEIYKILINNDMNILPINFPHLSILLEFEYFHRDPFDRIIIAQAIADNLNIITADANFDRYKVKTIWH